MIITAELFNVLIELDLAPLPAAQAELLGVHGYEIYEYFIKYERKNNFEYNNIKHPERELINKNIKEIL